MKQRLFQWGLSPFTTEKRRLSDWTGAFSRSGNFESMRCVGPTRDRGEKIPLLPEEGWHDSDGVVGVNVPAHVRAGGVVPSSN
jgi:hypothetical protein